MTGHLAETVSSVPQSARPLQGTRAGIASRGIANSIDVAIILVLMAVVYGTAAAGRFLVNPRTFTFPQPSPATVIIVGVSLTFLYFAVSWMTSGRTYGDHVLGLRVVGRRGGRLGPVAAIVRSALCTLFPIGLLWTPVDPSNRCLQDVVLRTSCVYDWEKHLD